MTRMLSKQWIRDALAGLLLLAAALSLVVWPKESMDAAKTGLQLCYNVIIPSLFPFFVLSALVVDFVFYFKLDKINMAEALKSVE